MQPSAVISHLHIPIIMQQVIIGMPFIIMQHDIIPPAIIVIMFCIIEHCILSSQLHMIFIPPSIFDIVILQRGIIIMFGIIPPMPIIPGIIIPPLIPISFIRPVIIVVMVISIFKISNSQVSKADTCFPHFPL